jgi:hypothetical protein
MFKELGYDSWVRRLNPSRIAVLALVIGALTFVPGLSAQINGAPPSVTSIGFGGHAQINGTPPSVTSIGFGGHTNPTPGVRPSVTSLGANGFNGTPAFPNCCINPLFPSNPNRVRSGRNHRRHDFGSVGGAVYAVPYPVVVDPGVEDDSADQEDYRGGPTIFDRRGPGTPVVRGNRYAQSAGGEGTSQPDPPADAAPAPAEDQPQTTLVFKDGQRLDVSNYAIVGNTLYDLTPGHRRKVALAELDLSATAKENDDRGIDFQLPPGTSKNSAN